MSIKSEKGKFDFSGYDAYFASLAKIPNKIRVALARVEYPYELSNEMLDVYQSFLKKQAVAVGKMLIDDDRIETLEMMGEKQLLTANAVTKLIDYAQSKDKVAITAWLLEYNHTTFGKSAAKKTKAAAIVSKAAPVKTDAEPIKSAAEWRKTFKFKYKDGGVIITGYLGTDECVTIPEKIGDKYVIGLGRGAFQCMGYDGSVNTTTKKIIVPGTITSIEPQAICIVKNLKIEIQEGIKELPEWAIDIVSNITVKLPASLVSINEQFGDSITESIKMIVPENSCAEEFCKKYKLSYTTYVPVVSDDNGKAEDIKEQLKKEKKQAASKKAAAPWKKPKAGTHLISRYLGQDTEVVFPTDIDGISIDGIANTSGDTPDNYKAIISVVIPEGYTYIGNRAFAGCENLETIELPSTLKEIGAQAFAGCKKLREIVIKKDIAFVGKDVFSGANIGTVVIETEKKTKIPSHLFFGCHIERLIVVGGPFRSNGNIFDYTGVSAGAAYAEEMYDGNFPAEVYINADFSTLDLKGIGGINAKRIHPLAEIDESIVLSEDFKNLISEEKKKVGKVAHNSGKVAETAEVKDIDFATSVFVLSGFNYEEEWDIKDAIEQRGGTLKDGVSAKINYLVVPDRDIVKNSKVKKVIEFQEKGKPISIIKLAECKKHMLRYDAKMFGEDGAKIASEYKLELIDGKITLKKYTGNHSDIVIPEFVGEYPVAALGEGCFEEGYRSAHKSKINSVVIPGCIKELSKNLFDYCQSLTSIVISEGVLVVGEHVFNECKELEEIVLPNSMTTISNGAFSRCEKLKRIVIPAGVTSVKSPFNGCENLEEIVVSENNTVYDSRDNCNAVIETATNTLVAGCRHSIIPATVTIIGDSAFCGLHSLTEFEVPEGIVEIGNNAFNGCFNLRSIKLPQSLVKIGYYAFSFCRELKKVELPLKVEEIHVSVFGNCENLTEFIVNDKLTEIKELDRAWMYNWRIKTVYGSAESIAKSIAEACRSEYIEI